MSLIYPGGSAEIVVPAGESVAVFSVGTANVSRKYTFPNYPCSLALLGVVNNGQTVFGSYSSGATIVVEAGASPVEYEVGVSPICDSVLLKKIQATPGTLNATGALTAALMLTGIVTSTTAAAVAGTVPTGATMDLAVDFAVNDSFDWSVINTGPNTFTVTAASGHTLVGAAAVATATSGRFRTVKTAADTYVTYRLS